MAQEIKRDGNVRVSSEMMLLKKKSTHTLKDFKEPEVPIEPNEQEGDGKRGILTDVPVQIMGGVRDGVQSTIGLWEKVSEDLSEKTNIGGWVFGDEAKMAG